jgi:hypothetical protein
MAASGSPTVRRRLLAAELRRLRGSRTGSEVSRGVGWSTTKISRAESGRETLPPSEVEKLIDYYDVADPRRTRLLQLAEDAAKRGWWDDYANALTPEYLEFVGLEAGASSCRHWQSDVVPGLLQTEGYSRQLDIALQSVVPTIPPAVHERFLRVRQLRQERLIHEPVLQLSAIIDEAVLLRGVGDRAVMRDQLAQLAEAAELPNISVRVLPLDRDTALGGVPSFAILSFGSTEETDAVSLGEVVETESLHAALYVEGEANTHLYWLFFQAIENAALSPAKSRDLIVTTIQRVWS